ncbi:nuclear cap-binding protein subunit 1-like [Haemaphysalis longicornis]
MTLTEHIGHCEVEGTNFQTYWFRWTLGRLQEVFFQHHEHVFKYVTTLESLLFTSDIDPHVLEVFQQFAALRA